MSPSATPAIKSARSCHQVRACHAKCTFMSPSAHACHKKGNVHVTKCAPATQSERSCHQVPRLPRTRAAASNAHKRVQARHQNQCSAVGATPATQSARGWHQVPRRSCDQAPTNTDKRVQARHQSQPSAVSATPATQSARGWHQVPRLARKVHVHVTKCNACHAREPWRQTRPSGSKRATKASLVP